MSTTDILEQTTEYYRPKSYTAYRGSFYYPCASVSYLLFVSAETDEVFVIVGEKSIGGVVPKEKVLSALDNDIRTNYPHVHEYQVLFNMEVQP